MLCKNLKKEKKRVDLYECMSYCRLKSKIKEDNIKKKSKTSL